MGTSGWSAQQLAEFVAAISVAESEASAAATAVERVAESLDAEVAAIVCDGRVVAAIGYPDGSAPIGELAAVKPGVEGSALEVPGVGAGLASAAPLEHPPGARLVIARGGPTGLTREETGLLRGMASVASLTMRMLRVLDNERAAREEVERLALDQAALRRVATLVAKAAPREDIYAVVAAEIAQRLGADVVAVLRYETAGTATIIGAWGVRSQQLPIGTPLKVAGEGVAVSVWHTRRPARVERFDGPPGSVAARFRSLGVHTGVGCPIMVDDDLWGVAFAATARRGALPAGSEARIAEFTQLVSAAIANAEARAEVRRIADEQAALRRVATLVARGVPASEVLGAVASETRAVLDSDISTLLRLEPDGMITVMATEGTLTPVVAVGERHEALPGGAVERALQTGRVARADGYEGEPGSIGDDLRALGYGGSASAPIVVAGRLWGVLSVIWAQGRPVPAGAEDRLMQFGELIATALANAEARADLRQVAEEQAALRRVATLVARGEPPSAVFAAVAVEAGRVIPAADVAVVGRYDPDDAVEFVGGWSRDGDPWFVGERVALGGQNVSTLVFQTAQPGRRDHIPDDSTPASAFARKWARSSAGAPITVEDRLWGVVIVGAVDEDALPGGTENRLGQFSELVATAIGNAEAREELRRVADDQAELRRVATLVARGAPPSEVFAAVAEAVGGLVPADATALVRFHADNTAELVAAGATAEEIVPVGARGSLERRSLAKLVRDAEAPVRMNDFGEANVPGPMTALGIRTAIGVPITVGGRVWGMIGVGSKHDWPMPAGTEERLADVSELVATAISNAQAREDLSRVADEQAALRRVATLVAAATPPAEVFSATAEEVGRLLSVDGAYVSRYDENDMLTVAAAWSPVGKTLGTGVKRRVVTGSVAAAVRDTERPSRVDRFADDLRDAALELGVRSAVAAPITVEGRLWGFVGVTSASETPLPPGIEERLADFTDLAATAIANADARAELTASRARIVASTDETRRRIERDLHDGAQAQLVTLGMRLRAAQASVPPDLVELAAEIDRIVAGLGAAQNELVELARGVHPPILAAAGLGPAVRTLGRRARIPVNVDVRTDRLPEPVEVGAYYVVSEALTNAVKHSEATSVAVEIEVAGGVLRIRVQDDGVGGAEFARGSGLLGLRDRVEALGGRIALESERGAGTSLSVELPLAPDPANVASR